MSCKGRNSLLQQVPFTPNHSDAFWGCLNAFAKVDAKLCQGTEVRILVHFCTSDLPHRTSIEKTQKNQLNPALDLQTAISHSTAGESFLHFIL